LGCDPCSVATGIFFWIATDYGSRPVFFLGRDRFLNFEVATYGSMVLNTILDGCSFLDGCIFLDGCSFLDGRSFLDGCSFLDGRSWTFILGWTLMDNYGRLRTLMDAYGFSWTLVSWLELGRILNFLGRLRSRFKNINM
jgi:hypothetical protein